MKKRFLLSILAVITIYGFSGVAKSSMNSHQQFTFYKTYFSKYPNADTVTLVFKVGGMKSEEDARMIDDILMKKSFIISSSTDFKTGLCKVETDKVENKVKIIEIICYSVSNKIGNKLTAELSDSIIEKE